MSSIDAPPPPSIPLEKLTNSIFAYAIILGAINLGGTEHMFGTQRGSTFLPDLWLNSPLGEERYDFKNNNHNKTITCAHSNKIYVPERLFSTEILLGVQ